MIRWVVAGGALGAPWVLNFSPVQWWWLGPLQLAGLLWLVRKQTSAWHAFIVGASFGALGLGLGVSWLYISLHDHGGLAAPLAVVSVSLFGVLLGLFPAMAAWVWFQASKALPVTWWLWVGPALWASAFTFFEWFRGFVFTGFAWLSYGDALVDSWVAGALPWLGNHGVAFFLIWAVCALLALCPVARPGVWGLSFKRPLAWVWVALLPVCVLVVLTQAEPHTQPGNPFHVVGVQTNVSQSVKFDPVQLARNMEKVFILGGMGRFQAHPEAALIFPETVNPLLWRDTPTRWLAQFRDYAVDRPGVTITGGAIAQGDQYFNSVVLFDGTETDAELEVPIKRHDKRHLVPFGETIPPGFKWFVRLLNMPLGEFTPGSGPLQPLMAQGNALAATVCYEDTFSDEFAALVRQATREPTVFLNLSNLAWFGKSWALDQHAQMGRTRSAEHRKPTIRVTNTGISGAIDEKGQWIKRVPSWQDEVWVAQVQGRLGLTAFALYGHFVWILIWMPLVLLLMLRFVLRRPYNRVTC